MNGPQHYREAEDALEALKLERDMQAKALMAGIAHVHATLALTAATRDQGSANRITAWDEATR